MKALLFLPFCAVIAACQPVGITDRATLSRPAFAFDSTGPRTVECGLSGQLETGRASASTVSAGGCASCR